MVDTWRAQNLARELKRFLEKVVDPALPIHEKMLLLAIHSRRRMVELEPKKRFDEHTLFASVCMAFGVWMKDTWGQEAEDYVVLSIPNDFNPRSVYNIMLYHEKRTEWLNAMSDKYGPIWPQKSWWFRAWDCSYDNLDIVEEQIWKGYIHKHSDGLY